MIPNPIEKYLGPHSPLILDPDKFNSSASLEVNIEDKFSTSSSFGARGKSNKVKRKSQGESFSSKNTLLNLVETTVKYVRNFGKAEEAGHNFPLRRKEATRMELPWLGSSTCITGSCCLNPYNEAGWDFVMETKALSINME